MRATWMGSYMIRCVVAVAALGLVATAAGAESAPAELPGAKISAESALWSPGKLAVDSGLELYVADGYRNRVQRFDRSGNHLGSIAVPRPSAVATAPDGALYIGSQEDLSVAIYRQGKRTGSLGSGKNEFASIRDIAVDPATGDIYVVDNVRSMVRVFYPSGIPKGMLAGFHLPVAVTVTLDEVYVLDAPILAAAGGKGATTGSRISVFNKGGSLRGSIDEYGSAAGQMARPVGIAVDRSGTIYVADALRKAVLVYGRNGAFIGRMESAADDLNTAVALALAPDNRLYVSSSETHGIVEIGLGGTVYAGTAGALAFIYATGERLTPAALGY